MTYYKNQAEYKRALNDRISVNSKLNNSIENSDIGYDNNVDLKDMHSDSAVDRRLDSNIMQNSFEQKVHSLFKHSADASEFIQLFPSNLITYFDALLPTLNSMFVNSVPDPRVVVDIAIRLVSRISNTLPPPSSASSSSSSRVPPTSSSRAAPVTSSSRAAPATSSSSSMATPQKSVPAPTSAWSTPLQIASPSAAPTSSSKHIPKSKQSKYVCLTCGWEKTKSTTIQSHEMNSKRHRDALALAAANSNPLDTSLLFGTGLKLKRKQKK